MMKLTVAETKTTGARMVTSIELLPAVLRQCPFEIRASCAIMVFKLHPSTGRSEVGVSFKTAPRQ